MMMTVRSAMTKLTSSNTNNTKRMLWCLCSRPSLVLQRRRFKLETTHLDDDIDDDECKKKHMHTKQKLS